MYFILLLVFSLKKKLHLKIAYTFNTFLKKFLHTRLFGLHAYSAP